jgi:hypothetical protein
MLGQFIGVTLTNSVVGLLAGALIGTVVGIVSYTQSLSEFSAKLPGVSLITYPRGTLAAKVCW